MKKEVEDVWILFIGVLSLIIIAVLFFSSHGGHFLTMLPGEGEAGGIKQTFQSGDWATEWETGGSYDCHFMCSNRCGGYSTSITTAPAGYAYSKAMRLMGGGGGGMCYGYNDNYHGYATMESKAAANFDYVSFVVHKAAGGGGASITFLDAAGNPLGSGAIASGGLHEFYRSGGGMYKVVDAVPAGMAFSLSSTPSYIRFKCGGSGQHSDYEVILDDITTSEAIIGLGVESNTKIITELDAGEIDVSWHVTTIPFAEYKAAEYAVVVRNAATGAIIKEVVVKPAGVGGGYKDPPPYRVLKFSKAMFGEGYGAYRFYLTRDGGVMATDYLIFHELPPGDFCSQIFNVTTASGLPIGNTSVVVENNATGDYMGECWTGGDGECSVSLDTSKICMATATKMGRMPLNASAVFAPCVWEEVHLSFADEGLLPNIWDLLLRWWWLLLLLLAVLLLVAAAARRRKKPKKRRKR